MSATIAQVAGWGNVARRGAELLFGGSGAVVLGEVTLEGFEVPESITIGGQQQMTVHKLPGGTRVIDAMGRDDAPLEWSGTLLGWNAVNRALQLDEMRVAGAPLALMFGPYYYTVVIESFRGSYQRDSLIPYSISCVVLRDETEAPGIPILNAAVQIASDIQGAIAFVEALTSPPPATGYATPAAALADAEAAAAEAAAEGFRRNTASQLAAARAAAQAQVAVDAAMVAAGAVLTATAAGAPSGSLVATLPAFQTAMASAEQAALLAASRGVAARAAQNAVLGSV